jgi:4-amino-4-deoxy-L-arabinose transferase-like glycosyltransferase
VTQPTPAIVAQHAVRRLPRVALWLFCLAYIVPGFFGRAPWKSADMTALGYMQSLATGASGSNWFEPQLMGLAPISDALLPYWLGAWAIQLAPTWLGADVAVRIAFCMLLALTLAATWYATNDLARAPQAQPVAFAFGGEANPPDYARAVADGGLLAFIACLGLAQLSHETTTSAAQLCFAALYFYAVAAMPYRWVSPALCAVAGLTGLALSGAPTVAMALGAGSLVVHWLDRSSDGNADRHTLWSWGIALLTVAVAALAWGLNLWHWRIAPPRATWNDWHGLANLLLWFTWPAWPLALWTLWRWRLQIALFLKGNISRHLALPLWFVVVPLADTLLTHAGDRALLLALPALAALAAFALPTLGRSVGALVDWFTLLFFSSCGIIIWVVWIALQTGVPPQPAANVARLAPGFVHSFSFAPFFIAVCASLAWAWLVKWRAGRHRAAIWKSLVLPAGGAALSWLLLMTLWMPLLDFARSYTALVKPVAAVIQKSDCVEAHGLDRGQIAAFQFHGDLQLSAAGKTARCAWLLVDRDAVKTLASAVDMNQWTPQYIGYRPTDRDDDVVLYRRTSLP